jgi:integrase
MKRTRTDSTVYALRFNVQGRRQYVTLGSSREGWTQAKAQDALQDELAKVQLGEWKAPEPAPAPTVESDPTFHVFATDWLAAHEGEWQTSTKLDYEWQLSHHLLPFFKRHRLSQITIAEVDRYRALKVKGALSATSINKTITRLAQILEEAVEHGTLERNPAKGKRRRLKASKPAPVWLDSAEHIGALLDAAGELDREAKSNGQVPRRAILSTLVFSGLRIGELIELRWRDVDLAAQKITVREAKTDAGTRTIDLLPILRAELEARREAQGSVGAKVVSLEAHRAGRVSGEAPHAHSSSRVFPTQEGGPMNPSNVRNRILAKAVERANERLEAAGLTPLPDSLTPHKLRHTFASLLVALGVDPGAVMDQLGHTDPTFTLRVYRHGMRRDKGSKQGLAQLVKRHRKGTRTAVGVGA